MCKFANRFASCNNFILISRTETTSLHEIKLSEHYRSDIHVHFTDCSVCNNSWIWIIIHIEVQCFKISMRLCLTSFKLNFSASPIHSSRVIEIHYSSSKSEILLPRYEYDYLRERKMNNSMTSHRVYHLNVVESISNHSFRFFRDLVVAQNDFRCQCMLSNLHYSQSFTNWRISYGAFE